MANIEDKTNLTNHGNLTETNELNWISQINVGDTIYDIATHHGITFKDGSKGSPVVWNGLTDLEIVIPSITDIVQTPIEFAGTVGENGAITWNAGHGSEPEVGNLLFITKDCTFADLACESGDMAIYDGTKWNVVSGENEVMLVAPMDQEDGNVATVAVGSSKNVLTVAGKTLALTLDYTELNKHLDKKSGGDEVVDLSSVKVASKRIGLSQATAEPKTIGELKTLTLATELKDGTVTFTGAENLVNSVNFGKLDPGAFPVYNKNTAAIPLSVSDGGLALNKTEGDDFVTGITLGNISIASATASDNNAFNMVTGVTSKEGTDTFVNGIITTNDSSEAAFTLKGYYIPQNGVDTKYVTGLGDGNDVVTNINAGSFELVEGTALATGFTSEEADSGDVVSSVSVTTGTTDVFSGAKVEGNVLSFSTSTVHSGNVTTTAKYKTLNKTGFKYTSATADKGGFTTAGFTKDNDVMYKVTTGKEKLWETTTQSVKIDTPTVTPTKGKYVINHDEMKATVPAETFYIGMTDGKLPSLSDGSVTNATLVGSVKTELATTTDKINVLSATSIDMPGAYSIVDVQTGGVEVGKAGALNDIETAIVDLEGYLTDVTVLNTAKA
jgi:hypothetical protein